MIFNHSLLSYIVKRNVKTKETAATDALGFILDKSKASRKGLSDLVQAKAIGVSPIASVQIQPSISGVIPDLACPDSSGVIQALLEAKFWAGLTPSQPNTYWENLPRDTPSALVFLVPTYRLPAMLHELTRRLENVGFESGGKDRSSDCITVRDKKSKRYLMLISWDELFRDLKKSAKAGDDSQALFELEQLRYVAVHESSEMGRCLCGCGGRTKRNAKVIQGHDARVREKLRRAGDNLLQNDKGSNDDLRLPAELVELARVDPDFKFVRHNAAEILELAKEVGVQEPKFGEEFGFGTGSEPS